MSTNPPTPGGILPPEMLNKFRQKYGKAYADMSDQQLSQAIVRKWPAYQHDLVQPQQIQPASVPQPSVPPKPPVPPQQPHPTLLQSAEQGIGRAATAVNNALPPVGKALPYLFNPLIGTATAATAALGAAQIGQAVGEGAAKFLGMQGRGEPRKPPITTKVATEAATQQLAGNAAAQGAARQQVQHAVEGAARSTASDMEKAAHPPMTVKPVVPPQIQAKMAQGIVANPSIKPVMDFIGQSNKVRQIGGTLGDKLYALQGTRQAEGIQMSRVLDQVTKDAAPGDMEAVYHELEKPSGKLTPRQQAIYNVLAPLRDTTEATNQALPGRQGNLISGIGYVRREPLQVGSTIDRVRAGVSGLGRSLLRKTTEGANHRTYWTMVDNQTGAKVLSHIGDDGRVTAIRGDSKQFIGTVARKKPFAKLMQEDITPIKQRIVRVQRVLQALQTHPARVVAANRIARVVEQIQKQATKMVDESFAGVTSASTRKALWDLGIQWRTLSNIADRGSGRIESLTRTLNQLNSALDEAVSRYNPETLDQTAFRANNGRTYRVTPATTREIESQTDQRYYKNAAYSVLTDYLDTAQAARANQFLQQAPLDPDWSSIAVPAQSMAGINAPKGWRVPDIPQLSNWKMDPRIAQKFENIVGGGRARPAEWVQKLESVQRGMVQVQLTANFVAHPTNMAGWGVLNRGIVRWMNPASYGRFYSSMVWAADQTIHMKQDYLNMLDIGAPLQYMNNVNLHKRLVEMAQQDLEQHPSLLEGLGSQLGLTPNRILKAIRTKSHDLAFMSSDMAYLQGVRERMLEGKAGQFAWLKPKDQYSAFEAMKATNRHFPTYRIPDWMPTVLRNNDFILFMPYHASSMEALANIFKDSVGLTSGLTVPQRAEALEKAALVVIAAAVLGPTGSTINRWVQSQTGNPQGRVRTSGPTSLPSQALRTITGETKALYGLESFITPSPITAMGISFIQYEAMHKAEPIQDTAVHLLKLFQQNATPYLFQQLQGAGWDQDIGKALLSIPGDLFLTLPKPPTKRSANPKTWY